MVDITNTPKRSQALGYQATRAFAGPNLSRGSKASANNRQSNQSSKEFDLEGYIGLIKQRHRHKLLKLKIFATKPRRAIFMVITAVLMLSICMPLLQELISLHNYSIGSAEAAVLTPTSKVMAEKLSYNSSGQFYEFNKNYTPRDPNNVGAGGPVIKAKIYEDATKGMVITDPINKLDLTIKPLFKLSNGRQQKNRVVYPDAKGGHLIYTAGGTGIKEDIILTRFIGDTVSYRYQLELGDQFTARLLANGSVGIYGSSLPLDGNVSTGSAADAQLLQKARQKAAKDKLLFGLPAPVIKETGGKQLAKAKFSIDGNILTLTAKHLKNAGYPLTIDPTVTAASGFGGNGLFSFDANIETNVLLDPSNGFFERSPLTGGNLLSWNSASSSTAAAHFLGAAVVYAGTLYVIGGTSGTNTTNISNGTNSHLIEQSKINSDGTLAGFTDGNYSGLPSGGLARFQVLTYNGYIYLIDGINGFTSLAAGGTVSNNIYYTRVTSESFGAFTNGAQLKNWGTTTNKPSTAVYDYAATVYNGSVYVAGGLNSAGTAQTAALYAAILPNGDLGTFNAASAALPAGRFGMDMQAYNGHLYIVGGNTGTLTAAALTATTLYASIAADGSIDDSAWKSGNSLVSSNGASTQGIESFGNQFSMIYNGYLYVAGGCGTVNSTGSCTNVLNYAQLAQINADGSLGTFFPNGFQNGGNATLARTGTPTFGYNGAMYSIAGCSAMNSTTVSCATTTLTTTYATVNSVVGDVSNNRNPGDLPVALYGQAMVVLNGFLYVLGGCLTVSCSGTRVTNYDTYWATINADGTLGAWDGTAIGLAHADSTRYTTALHRDSANGAGGGDTGNSNCSTNAGLISGQSADNCGLAGMAAAVYNGYIYVFGGADGANLNRSVYYQQPNATNGAIGTWSLSSQQFSTAVAELGAFARNGALYILGGCTGGGAGIGCTAYQTQVQKSTIGAAGAPGAWSATTPTPTQLQLPANGRAAFGLALSGDYIYLAGGIDNANDQLSTVIRAKLNSSGNIVTVSSGWAATTGSMSAPRRRTVSAVVNGFLYVIAGHDASANGGAGATYGDIQIGKIDMSSGGTGDITSFTQSSTGAVTLRWNPALAVGAGFIFVTGGCTVGPPPGGCTAIGTTNEAFVVYNANNLGVNAWNTPAHTYSSSSPDPAIANRLGSGAVAYNGYLYVAGGCLTYTVSTTTCSLASTDIVYAPINADGTLGTWVSSTALANLYAFNQLVALNGTLYLLTGQNSTGVAKSIVRYSVIGANGAPGTWTDASNSLPITLTQAGVVTYANRIYVAGGYDNNTATNQKKIYISPALPTGGDITSAWSTATTDFTTARRELTLVSAGAYLFVIGGYDGTNYFSDVQVSTPNTSTGDISSWSFNNEIPYKEAGMSGFGANGYVYLFGGRNGNASTSCTKAANFAAINGNGTMGEWQQAPNTLATARFGTASAYSNGYIYVNGGNDCTGMVATSSAVQQSGQLSEAIHATYTRYVDFGTDATFRQLYVLGTNAAISGTDIDRWKVIVKTSTSANNNWGQKYTTSLTGLGTGPTYGSPITFQALDASGVDQGAAQYWDITFDIDQTQSFNFPDAATPPQITKYDFYFSPGPGKRLRNGKTFVNNQQTTLDAHP